MSQKKLDLDEENSYNLSEKSSSDIENLSSESEDDDTGDILDENENDSDSDVMDGGADESEDEYNNNREAKNKKPLQPEKKNIIYDNDVDDDSDEDDSDEDLDENYLMKFDREIRKNYLTDYHPETLISNYEEIQALVNIKRDARGIIIDEFHKTLPFLTKYEKTRILGQRAKQINSGSKPYLDKSMLIQNGKPIIDGYLIALKELELKKIPFIIRRPLPNGGSEYWRLTDLEIIN
jgi:DNA-directed RNA polymerase subunit K/omega